MGLPGVNTHINDRFYTISRTNIPAGPKVVIFGRRTTPDHTGGIATLDVYQAASELDVLNVFGEQSDLHRGYLEAVSGGAQTVLLVALPSDTTFNHGNASITSASYNASTGFATPSSTGLWDAVWAAVESAQADIVVPWGRGSGPTEFQNPATPGDDAEFGFYADNSSVPSSSWAYKVASKAAEITANTYPCFAVLGVKPYSGMATSDGGMTPAAVANYITFPNLVSRDADLMSDVGLYLQVVAAEMKPVGYNTNYTFGFSNSAAQYAGYIAQLDSWSSPTSKSVFNVSQIRYNPTRTQQQSMINAGVVPVGLNFSNVATWIDAQTFAATASQYTRLTTLRIIFDAVQVVRQISQQYIGEASTLSARNALETSITKGLLGMQQAGALLASDFTVTYDAQNSKAIVDLVLTPAFELRNIEIQVSINT